MQRSWPLVSTKPSASSSRNLAGRMIRPFSSRRGECVPRNTGPPPPSVKVPVPAPRRHYPLTCSTLLHKPPQSTQSGVFLPHIRMQEPENTWISGVVGGGGDFAAALQGSARRRHGSRADGLARRASAALNAKRPDIRVFSQSGRSLVVQCGGLGFRVEAKPLGGALSSPRRGGARPSVLRGCS